MHFIVSSVAIKLFLKFLGYQKKSSSWFSFSVKREKATPISSVFLQAVFPLLEVPSCHKPINTPLTTIGTVGMFVAVLAVSTYKLTGYFSTFSQAMMKTADLFTSVRYISSRKFSRFIVFFNQFEEGLLRFYCVKVKQVR